MIKFEFIPAYIGPDKPGHYLTISDMNWYHGGNFEKKAGTEESLSYRIAYWNHGWDDPYIMAWTKLPDFPEKYKSMNRELLKDREKNLRPMYGTTCDIK